MAIKSAKSDIGLSQPRKPSTWIHPAPSHARSSNRSLLPTVHRCASPIGSNGQKGQDWEQALQLRYVHLCATQIQSFRTCWEKVEKYREHFFAAPCVHSIILPFYMLPEGCGPKCWTRWCPRPADIASNLGGINSDAATVGTMEIKDHKQNYWSIYSIISIILFKSMQYEAMCNDIMQPLSIFTHFICRNLWHPRSVTGPQAWDIGSTRHRRSSAPQVSPHLSCNPWILSQQKWSRRMYL